MGRSGALAMVCLVVALGGGCDRVAEPNPKAASSGAGESATEEGGAGAPPRREEGRAGEGPSVLPSGDPPAPSAGECSADDDCALYNGCPGCECQAHAAGSETPACVGDESGCQPPFAESGEPSPCWESEARCVQGRCQACAGAVCQLRAEQVPPEPELPSDGSCNDDRQCALYNGCPGCECQAQRKDAEAPACMGDEAQCQPPTDENGDPYPCWESEPRCIEGVCRACVGDLC